MSEQRNWLGKKGNIYAKNGFFMWPGLPLFCVLPVPTLGKLPR